MCMILNVKCFETHRVVYIAMPLRDAQSEQGVVVVNEEKAMHTADVAKSKMEICWVSARACFNRQFATYFERQLTIFASVEDFLGAGLMEHLGVVLFFLLELEQEM